MFIDKKYMEQIKSKWVITISYCYAYNMEENIEFFSDQKLKEKLYFRVEININEDTDSEYLLMYKTILRRIPVSEVEINVLTAALKKFELSEREDLLGDIKGCKSIKHLTIVNFNTTAKTSILNLDLKTPNEEDEQLFNNYLECLFINCEMFIAYQRDKDKVKILPI
jgi:hypothetical protein